MLDFLRTEFCQCPAKRALRFWQLANLTRVMLRNHRFHRHRLGHGVPTAHQRRARPKRKPCHMPPCNQSWGQTQSPSPHGAHGRARGRFVFGRYSFAVARSAGRAIEHSHAGVVKLVDALDSKSSFVKECRFDSDRQHKVGGQTSFIVLPYSFSELILIRKYYETPL